MVYERQANRYALMSFLTVAFGLSACAAEPPAGEVDGRVGAVQKAICAECEPGGEGDDPGDGGDGGGQPSGGGGTGASFPLLVFYPEVNCGGNSNVGWYPLGSSGMTKVPNTSGSGWVNDEAKSVKLFRIPAGSELMVFDSKGSWGGGVWSDGETSIYTHQYIDVVCIGTFDQYQETPAYMVRPNKVEGSLNGQVSYVEAHLP